MKPNDTRLASKKPAEAEEKSFSFKRHLLIGLCTCAAMLAALVAVAPAQTLTATSTQQANFTKHLLLQMAGIGRPSEETARRQTAFVQLSGITSSDAALVMSAAASLAAAVAPINQQAAAIGSLGSGATTSDKLNLANLNQQAQQLTANAAASLLSAVSADGLQRLSAIAAKQP